MVTENFYLSLDQLAVEVEVEVEVESNHLSETSELVAHWYISLAERQSARLTIPLS